MTEELQSKAAHGAQTTEAPPTFYTSDHHFHHANIGPLCGRPLQDPEEMREEMITRWNETVPPHAIVRHLGDFSLNFSAVKQVAPRLNGHIVLYAGNHDACWAHHKKAARAAKMVSLYEEYFDEVIPSGMGTVTIQGHQVLLSHLPYHGDSHHDDRYAALRPRDEGLPIVCGHVHNTWSRMYGGDGRMRQGQLNVGVDVWDFRPVPEATVADMLGLS